MLVIIGSAPISKIASIVAIKLNDCVMTSSPLLTPNALSATLIVQFLDTQSENLELNF